MKQEQVVVTACEEKQHETIVSPEVFERLSQDEIQQALSDIVEAMNSPGQEEANLWEASIHGHRVWGVIDDGAGPHGEPVLCLIFPFEY